jgi:hypothetical protein
MKPMATSVLSAKEICEIIAVCKLHKVQELRQGEFFIKFEEEVKLPPVTPETKAVDAGDAVIIEKSAIANEELEIRDRQMAEMMIENPLEYEKLLEQGELEHAAKKHN